VAEFGVVRTLGARMARPQPSVSPASQLVSHPTLQAPIPQPLISSQEFSRHLFEETARCGASGRSVADLIA
jgi:hypothetical protein